MSMPILASKLYIPSPRHKHIFRPRLIERLNEGLSSDCKLILVSAPAGFGKTTLVSEWVVGCGRPVAWLSLDVEDKDPARFIAYLILALRTIEAGIGKELLTTLQSPQPLQIETILTTLLNEISILPEHFLLILDDYHLLDSQPVDQALTFIIEHQPPQMHLVIVTREDPSLPLARLRARGQCAELRAAELRFTPAEAAEFLNCVMGLTLSYEDVVALEIRTEGWIAGLQLAAIALRSPISMQELPNVADFIQSFTGSHRFVLDYLLEEVLLRQRAETQVFLLRTSILDRMCSPLCDAVLSAGTGLLNPAIPGQAIVGQETEGQKTLEYLERANLFIVPLDNERRWYRYHHLFSDLLRKRLQESLTAEGIAELHIHASQWYENSNLMLEGFRHAAAANDVERAVRLMGNKQMPLHQRGAAATILKWLEALPESVKDARPVLWWKQAALMLTTGQTIGVKENLQAAETALEAKALPGAELNESIRELIGKIAAVRANLAETQAQTEVIFVQARRALEYLHPNNLSERSTAYRMLGFAHYWQDDWAEAIQAYTEALSLAQAAGDITNTMLASIRLGQIREDQNQLHLAAETYQQALKLISDTSNPNAVVAYLGLSQIFYQWNHLDAAEQYAEQGLRLAQQYTQIIDRIVMSELHLALIKLAKGDGSGAAKIVSQADQTARQKNFALRLPNIAFFQALISLHQGNLGAAAQLTLQYDLPLMRARVFIRQDDPSSALAVLEPLRQQSETKGSARRLLDVMTVQSLALYASGDREKAVDLLGKVFAQAEPNGFIRLFVDEGTQMAELLSAAVPLGIRTDYVHKLLATFAVEPKEQKPTIAVPGGSSLVEPLSQRELEVLSLIAQGLSNQEIGQRLFLALDTIKGHNRRIFEKLQVQRRTEAIARARALGLI